jgi:valyl-tRNA synthetase
MPFVTEEIYQTYYKKNEKQSSIHLERWPKADNSNDSKDFDLLIKILTKVRQAKSNAKKSMNSEILLTISKEDKEKIQPMLQDLMDVTNAQNIIEGKFKIEFL